MTAKPPFALLVVLALLMPTATLLWADQEALDELAKKEQAETDNEAVSVYAGKVDNVEAIFFIEWAGTGSPVEGRYYLFTRG